MDNRLFGPAQAPLPIDNREELTRWLARQFGNRFNRLPITRQLQIALGAGAVVSHSLISLVSNMAPIPPWERKRKFEEFSVDPNGGGVIEKRSFTNLRRQAQMDDPSSVADVPAVSSLRGSAPAAASSGGVSDAYGKGKETRVVPPPRHIAFGIPDFYTAKLMYNNAQDLTLGAALDSATADYEIRVNSIFDVLSIGAGSQQPTWRNHFSTFYDYYTVLSMEYHVTFEQKANASNGTDLDINMRTYGSIVPSSYTQYSAVLQNDPMVTWKVLELDTTRTTRVTFSGVLTHQDYLDNIQEVQDNTEDEVWTPMGQNPNLVHVLRFMPRRRTGTAPAGNSLVYVDHKLVYTVQFRQLKQAYHFNSS